MALVYANSALTIVAAAAANSWDGLFNRGPSFRRASSRYRVINYQRVLGGNPVVIWISEKLRATPIDMSLSTTCLYIPEHGLCKSVCCPHAS